MKTFSATNHNFLIAHEIFYKLNKGQSLVVGCLRRKGELVVVVVVVMVGPRLGVCQLVRGGTPLLMGLVGHSLTLRKASKLTIRSGGQSSVVGVVRCCLRWVVC